MQSASPGFQPAGRAPAPPPLDLVQDFVNTEIPEWAQDDIATPELFGDWLRARSLLEVDDVVAAEVFVSARVLRASLRRLALLNTLGERPDEQARIELESALAPVRYGVVPSNRGELRLTPIGPGGRDALGAIVARVLEAQATGAWSRLKACRKPGCGWLFYDGSRNASSIWCSMSICGNRTKTAAYRRRRQA